MEMIIGEAIRELRKAYGLSQQAFATLLGMAIVSVANYETGARIPDAPAAVKLYRAAEKKERQDLADAFVEIIYEAMGGMVMPIQNEQERRKVRAVQLILSDPRFGHLRKPLDKLLAPVEKHIRESAAFVRVKAEDIPGIAAQMIKLQQESDSPSWPAGWVASSKKKTSK